MRRLGTWDNIVRRWRKRWLARNHEPEIIPRLVDEPRSGKPASITPEQTCQIVALACEPPSKDDGPPITQRSLPALGCEAVRRGIIETISPGSVGRILKRNRPQAAPEPLLAER
ncbi:MAG: helix-turn-helix domain-containing protein, partial [Rhodobacteraceae bacterium]|nr:helix-turn-helix domain-containing protein [Paracoccaceae bacterium]